MGFSLKALLSAAISAAVVNAAIGPVTDLHIVNKDITPDGFERPTVLAEGTFPGPLIKGNKGDNFQLNVIDQLVDDRMLTATSIHWHGLFQKGTNWADGPAFVTQCPIVANDSFLYNFTVPGQAGTYWYHSHLSTQYCDGLRGPLVVYDPNDPNKDLYDIDDESTVITLADWYHVLAQTVTGVAIPDSTLINGLGRSPGNLDANLSVITVERSKRYRFRLVSISCDPNFIFSIDNHTMTVIEADGVNTQSLTVDSIQIFAGQRYSFVLQANQHKGNYWIRAMPNNAMDTSFNGGLNSAILRYVGAPDEEPTTIPTPVSKTPLLETNLHPLVPQPVPGSPFPGGADFNHNFTLAFSAGRFSIDGASWIIPSNFSLSVLLQILSGQMDAHQLLPQGSILDVGFGQVVELSFPPGTAVGGPHPFHLHGHNFWVVRSAGSDQYNFNNPIVRDVVSIGNNSDLVTIRYVTDNAGPWFLHCHIDWHLETGFGIVLAEGINQTKAANPVPPAWDQLCSKYSATLPTTAAVAVVAPTQSA
ncbi:Laccase [Cerrena zonata]|uniref:laccase n=1 Tax=Cerrena zonata TaxID=2478898 RepID=A0AAW0GAT7_9APHY